MTPRRPLPIIDTRRRPTAALGDKGQEWYRFTAQADDSVRIDIYDFIGYDPWFDDGASAKRFAKDLQEITASTIELHINSPGGDVYEAIAIYNALVDHA